MKTAQSLPMQRTVQIHVNDAIVSFEVEGETIYGPEEILLDQDDNLIAHTSWYQDGYSIQPFLAESDYQTIVSGIEQIVCNILVEVGVDHLQTFELKNYHHFVDDIQHAAVIEHIRGCFPIEQFPIDGTIVAHRIEQICGIPVTSFCAGLDRDIFCIRIVRPNSKNDNNPPHRDVWLNRLRNAVNIYVPICASDERSSLPLVPGSHLWKESEIERTVAGARVNGLAFTVPSVTGAKRDMVLTRPNPHPNELMIFSPYLIHGGGVNLNTDTTRVSLEMRFWRKP